MAHALDLSTELIEFGNVVVGQPYSHALTITNPLPSPVELVIRAGNAERYTIVPDELALEAGASATVEVRLRLTKPPPRRAGGGALSDHNVKDTFLIRSSFGVQRFFAQLAPSTPNDEGPAAAASAPEPSPPPPFAQAAATAAAARLPWPAGAAVPTAEELAAAHAAHLRELQAAPIVEQLDALQHANEVLQAEVLSTAAALAHSRAEVDRLHSMQAELVRETPDVEAVLATVHAEHEAKSARVLAVLRGKDDEMAALAEENTALRDALAEREAAAEATREGAQLAATNFELLLREKGEAAATHAAQALSLAEARQAAAEAAEKAHGLENALEARDEEIGRLRASEAAATAAHAAAREQLEEQALKLAHLESEREMRQAQAQELERREQRFYGLVESTVADEHESEAAAREKDGELTRLRAALAEKEGSSSLLLEHADGSGLEPENPALKEALEVRESAYKIRLTEVEEEAAAAEAARQAAVAELAAEREVHGVTASKQHEQVVRLAAQLEEAGAELLDARAAVSHERQARADAEAAAAEAEAELAPSREAAAAAEAKLAAAAAQQESAAAAHAAELSEQQELLQRLSARVSSLTRAEADGKGRRPSACRRWRPSSRACAASSATRDRSSTRARTSTPRNPTRWTLPSPPPSPPPRRMATAGRSAAVAAAVGAAVDRGRRRDGRPSSARLPPPRRHRAPPSSSLPCAPGWSRRRSCDSSWSRGVPSGRATRRGCAKSCRRQVRISRRRSGGGAATGTTARQRCAFWRNRCASCRASRPATPSCDRSVRASLPPSWPRRVRVNWSRRRRRRRKAPPSARELRADAAAARAALRGAARRAPAPPPAPPRARAGCPAVRCDCSNWNVCSYSNGTR